MALDKVQDYVSAARTLLQDTDEVYRYSNDDLVLGLSMGLMEARRLRPDLFLSASMVVPSFTITDFNNNTAVALDVQYRVALLYYIVGQANLRDTEENQDARATDFMGKFTGRMLATAA